MKRSDVFNTHRPYPLDRYVYPVYDQFTKLQQEILTNWRQEAISGTLGLRGYSDMNNLRISVTKSGEPVIRLKPFMGFETTLEIELYTQFFKSYNDISKGLLMHLAHLVMERGWLQTARQMGTNVIEEEQVLLQHKLDVYQSKLAEHRPGIHMQIMLLAILVAVMKKPELSDEIKMDFIKGIQDNTIDLVHFVNGFIDQNELEYLVGKAFQSRESDFFVYPDPKLVRSYWDYAEKNVGAILSEEETGS